MMLGLLHKISSCRLKMLLKLPPELRSKIYAIVVATCPCNNPRATTLSRHQTALEILLTNHQIYNEAREIVFQTHTFQFHAWSGTGIHFCNMFLKHLHSWQLRSLNKISLWVVESCLIDMSSSNPTNVQWTSLCSILGNKASLNGAGLRQLNLTIEGCLWMHGSALLDAGADWVTRGIQNLQSLHRLEILFAGGMVEARLATQFRTALSKILPTTIITILGIVQGRKMYLLEDWATLK